MKNLVVLGATGSIGQQTLAVVRQHPDKFHVWALTAHKNYQQILADCLEFKPRYAVMSDPLAAQKLKVQLNEQHSATQVEAGTQALVQLVAEPEVELVMAAIVGAAGLPATFKAAQAGKTLLLANKEVLVMAGELFMDTCHKASAELLPVDSEHSAIYQCLATRTASIAVSEIAEIVLTASGGPFLRTATAKLTDVTPEQALKHPNWDMGQKISIDSATMFNKALEIIEAYWLFGLSADKIKAVIHPQSIIHSIVSYRDGSSLAQLGRPDMRTAIAYALAQARRIDSGVSVIDWAQMRSLEFLPVDTRHFPAMELVYQVLAAGKTAPAVFNAANEVAVEAFLNRRIKFNQIAQLVAEVLEQSQFTTASCIEAVIRADSMARKLTKRICETLEN